MTHITIAAIAPLLAADGWSTIIGLLIFIFWSALQWLSSRNEARQQQKPRRPKPPQPVDRAEGRMPRQLQPGRLPQGQAAPRGQVAVAPRNQEDALRSEVEAFLRRAQGQPEAKEPSRPERPQQPERSQPQRSQPQRSQPQRSQPQQYTEQRRTLVSKAPREEPSGRPGRPQQESMEGQNLRHEGVAEHVAKHLSTQDIAAHTRALGETVGLTDERLESRLHAKFDHSLGSLKHRDTPADIKQDPKDLAAADFATEIVEMLRDPAGMRKLIVANEILRRPEW